jgi:chloride channel protein, CIC family
LHSTGTPLERLRHRLATADALPQMAILGVLAGASTGIVMLLFRAAIELPLQLLLPEHGENFEALPQTYRVLLVIGGALLVGISIQCLRPERRNVGVIHVLERLTRHQGHLPLRNAIVQFVFGALALISGQSGGREGPAVHLGATASSLLGRYLQLPNNSLRLLVACGSGAAIAGSFNTPLAGVIFAMEVVMMEYTISSFIPVILAAVTATLLSRAVFGDHTAFVVPADIQIHSLLEYPIIVVEGVLIGCIASAYLAAMALLTRLPLTSDWGRIALAGIATAVVGSVVPEVLGIGYDTVEEALTGQLPLALLALIVIAKLAVSAITYALRVPVGIIGPTLVVGACAGAALGSIGRLATPEFASDVGIYVMLGMGAMMGAVLQAPLAALVAVVELTGTPAITLPAMLAIVLATVTTASVFKQRSVFMTALQLRGLTYPADPVALHLQRVGVSSAMERNFVRLEASIKRATAEQALARQPRWIVVDGTRGPQFILNAADLRRHLEDPNGAADESDALLNLKELPGIRMDVASVDFRATMYEAWQTLKKADVEALCVRRVTAPLVAPTLGVLTRDDILRYARFDG